jgi:hypothetical protein
MGRRTKSIFIKKGKKMKTTIQKMLQASLCLAILISLIGSTISYGMEQESAIEYLSSPKVTNRWPFSKGPNGGTPENNPLLWIKQNASNEQLDLIEDMNIERMNREKNKKYSVFRVSKSFKSMPEHVKTYLGLAFDLILI